MAGRLSRRRVAAYVAEQVLAGKAKPALSQLAAYLVTTRQTNKANLFVRDIEAELIARGVVVAEVTTAYELSDGLRADIQKFLQDETTAKDVSLREAIDPSVLGGVRIRTATQEFDGTIRKKLTTLRTEFNRG